LRHSFDRAAGRSALHLISAWAADQRLVLGQLAVDGQSNEITAVPKLLDMLSLGRTIVTVDALNCQRDIARQIVDQGGDYVLALKGNQGTLHADVALFLDDPQLAADSTHTTVDGDHGRIESRTATVSNDIAWLQEQHAWPGLAAAGQGPPQPRDRCQDHYRDRLLPAEPRRCAPNASLRSPATIGASRTACIGFWMSP
jgi:predicted transposase YbfD/YdcC